MNLIFRVFRPAVLLLALLVPGALRAQGALPLQAEARAVLGSGDGWSALAWNATRGTPLFEVNPDEIRTPASNNKVFTAVWALETFGPEHRFSTDLLLTAPIRDGVVAGNVVLRGSGDPTFGYPVYERDPMDPLRVMARELRARGVRVVQGGVLADGTLFGDSLYGPEWPRDTGNGVARYAPRVSGLSFQRNMLRIQVIPTRGSRPQVVTSPRTDRIPVISRVTSGGGRAWAVRGINTDTIEVKGSVSGRGPYLYEIGVAQPALLAGEALRQALQEAGIEVRQPTRLGKTPNGALLVHRHFSIPLAEMVREMNTESDNFFAEQLWKATVARVAGRGTYRAGGPKSAIFFASHAHMPFGELWQADGSGLSAENRVSARAMVSALLYADGRPWSGVFHRSLPVAGGREGTLRRLFRGTAAAGNLHAKTGYIRGVRSLSGYVRSRGGDLVVFSLLYNGNNTNGARRMQEQLGTLLAEYRASAPAPVVAEQLSRPDVPAAAGQSHPGPSSARRR